MSSKREPVGAMERNDGIRSVLLRASVYRAVQRAIGSNKSSRRLAAEVIRSTSESVVVDIGCGTADIADYIQFSSYTGFDPNPPYVEQAAARLGERVGDRAKIFRAGIGERLLIDRLPRGVDLAIAMGVLHHLDDRLVDETLQLASLLVGPHGRFVAFDPGLIPHQSRIARALITRDRGQHVRTVEATDALVRRHFSDVTITAHHDFLAVPYTHLVVQATNPS